MPTTKGQYPDASNLEGDIFDNSSTKTVKGKKKRESMRCQLNENTGQIRDRGGS